MRTLSGHTDWVRTAAVSDDGRWIVSGGNDQTVRLWESESGENRAVLTDHSHVIECVVFAGAEANVAISEFFGVDKALAKDSGTQYFASGSRDKTIKIWDTNTLQ
ncbi:Platelet-activating factor acetylhydrolase IB subunit alpha, partial [Nowakowskiella sp. JEL0078]